MLATRLQNTLHNRPTPMRSTPATTHTRINPHNHTNAYKTKENVVFQNLVFETYVSLWFSEYRFNFHVCFDGAFACAAPAKFIRLYISRPQPARGFRWIWGHKAPKYISQCPGQMRLITHTLGKRPGEFPGRGPRGRDLGRSMPPTSFSGAVSEALL